MVYNSVLKKTVLFGGMGMTGKSHNETWAWDGSRWLKLYAEGDAAPQRRYRHRMAFDSQAGTIVLFGGLLTQRAPAETGDTWILDGKGWADVKPLGPAPKARNSHVMAYDPVRRKTILYGGAAFDGKAGTIFQDTWEWDGRSWRRAA
jgi:hypothetical protein